MSKEKKRDIYIELFIEMFNHSREVAEKIVDESLNRREERILYEAKELYYD